MSSGVVFIYYLFIKKTQAWCFFALRSNLSSHIFLSATREFLSSLTPKRELELIQKICTICSLYVVERPAPMCAGAAARLRCLNDTSNAGLTIFSQILGEIIANSSKYFSSVWCLYHYFKTKHFSHSNTFGYRNRSPTVANEKEPTGKQLDSVYFWSYRPGGEDKLNSPRRPVLVPSSEPCFHPFSLSPFFVFFGAKTHKYLIWDLVESPLWNQYYNGRRVGFFWGCSERIVEECARWWEYTVWKKNQSKLPFCLRCHVLKSVRTSQSSRVWPASDSLFIAGAPSAAGWLGVCLLALPKNPLRCV